LKEISHECPETRQIINVAVNVEVQMNFPQINNK